MREGNLQSSNKGCFSMAIKIILAMLIGPFFLSVLLIPLNKSIDSGSKVIPFLYLAIFIAIACGVVFYYRKKRKKHKEKSKAEEFITNPHSVTLRTHKLDIVLNNPFRGVFVLGAAGSGKSESVGIPLLEQFIMKEYSGIVYDFKFPTLASEVEGFLHILKRTKRTDLKHYYLDFNNPLQSHRVNPLNPKYLLNTSYAREYAQAIISNLMKESIKKPDFWSRSATDILTACIWYLKEEHPEMCDLPHVLAMITSNDVALVAKLQENPITQQMTMSIYNVMARGADNQVSGVIGTLQGVVAQINTPELMYVFGKDDFSLDVNDADNPSIVTIGSYPTLTSTFAPLCSLVITVATKLMNQPNKRESFVLLDEAPTVFIPNLEVLPNTGRSNKIATVVMCQDLSQLVDGYGKEKADVLFASCNNHFYGRVASSYTSETLSKQFGKQDKGYVTTSKGSSRGSSFSASTNYSETVQERDVIKASEFLKLEVGEFAGIAVDSNVNFFKTKFYTVQREKHSLPNQHFFNDDINFYYKSVRADIDNLLS